METRKTNTFNMELQRRQLKPTLPSHYLNIPVLQEYSNMEVHRQTPTTADTACNRYSWCLLEKSVIRHPQVLNENDWRVYYFAQE